MYCFVVHGVQNPNTSGWYVEDHVRNTHVILNNICPNECFCQSLLRKETSCCLLVLCWVWRVCCLHLLFLKKANCNCRKKWLICYACHVWTWTNLDPSGFRLLDAVVPEMVSFTDFDVCLVASTNYGKILTHTYLRVVETKQIKPKTWRENLCLCDCDVRIKHRTVGRVGQQSQDHSQKQTLFIQGRHIITTPLESTGSGFWEMLPTSEHACIWLYNN